MERLRLERLHKEASQSSKAASLFQRGAIPGRSLPSTFSIAFRLVSKLACAVQAIGKQGVERLLDVGGGSAAYSIASAQTSERVHATVLDLPNVLPIAQRHINEAGLTARIETRVGDLRRDRFGSGFNLVLALTICHMLGPEENKDLLRRCIEALEPQGCLVIPDFILESDKTAPKQAALFALNMLIGAPAGSTYSADEYITRLRAAGFQEIRQIQLPGPASLMVGTLA